MGGDSPLPDHVGGVSSLLELAWNGRHIPGDAGAREGAAEIDLVDVVWQPSGQQARPGG